MELDEVIKYVVGGLVAWNAWLSIRTFDMNSRINVNSALDEKTQETLKEIKADISGMKTDIAKILSNLNSK